MNVVDRAWLAGLLEGEACFCMRKPRPGQKSPAIQVGMTDEDTIARVAALFKRKYREDLSPYRVNRSGGNYKRVFLTAVAGQDAVAIMREVYPFMGERRRAKIREIIG